MPSMKYTHTNIIAKDWEKLALFYEKVFNCKVLNPKRNLSGKWIDDLTKIDNVQIKGAHLLLPGYGDNGPTLFHVTVHVSSPFSTLESQLGDVPETTGVIPAGNVSTTKTGSNTTSPVFVTVIVNVIVSPTLA